MKNNLKYIGLLAGALLSAPSLMAADSTSSDTQSMIFGLFVLMAFILVILLFVLARIIKSLTSNKDLWMEQIKTKGAATKAAALLAVFALSTNSTFAQAASASEGFKITSGMFDIIITLNVILLVFVFALVIVLRKMINALRSEEQEETSVASDITHILTDSVPVEREHEIMTDHDYDGIKELDNNLPPWWVWGFYMTIVFAFVYVYYYHISGSNWSSKSEYQVEMADAAAAKEAYMSQMANAIDESSVTFLTAEADLSAGKEIFTNNCQACHGGAGEGGVGPNLTDDYWIHGGGIKEVFSTIKYGVPAKGMIAWETQLSPSQMQKVASYIKTLKGTNPPNAKEPQGDLWIESGESTSSSAPNNETDTAAVAVAQ